MLDFDEKIKNYLSRFNASYYRYCDDILIICDEDLGLKIGFEVERNVKNLKIKIHPDKTKRVYFKDGLHVFHKSHMSKDPLQYLGFTFNGKNILLRDSGLIKYQYKVSKAIRMSNKKLLRINSSRIRRGEEPLEIHKKHIYRRFSFIGKRNYISYALRAALIMSEPAIKKQIKPHWTRIQSKLEKFDLQNKETYMMQKK